MIVSEVHEIRIAILERDKKIRTLIADNERLRAALLYYAQPETYFIDFKTMAGLPTVCVDNGDIARAALEI